MNVERCDHCERAFHNVRWVDLRTGEIATRATFDHGEKARLCWDCQDVVREERGDRRVMQLAPPPGDRPRSP